MKPNLLLSEIGSVSTKGAGIYMILCVPNETAYIGQSKHIDIRWRDHKYLLRLNKHKNSRLQNCYNKYGKQSIVFFVLENSSEDLSTKEANWLFKIDEDCRLNLSPITEVIPISKELLERRKKIKKTPEQIEMSRRAMKLCWEDPIWRQNQIDKRIGKKWSEEQRVKMSKISKGRKMSDDFKEKIKASWIKRKLDTCKQRT